MYDLSPVESVQDGDVTIQRVPVQYSGYFAVQEPASGYDAPPALLVAFHGYGQSCKGFIRNFASLRERNWLVIAPQGLNQFYWERGKAGFCWMTSHMRGNTVRDNLAYAATVLERVRDQYMFDDDRVFFLGFSQGSAMAFRAGARGNVRPAGVISCGGDLPPDVEVELDQIPRFPVLIVHGREDNSMSFEKAQTGEKALRDHGFNVTTNYFDGAHDLPPEVIDHAVVWMEERFARARSA